MPATGPSSQPPATNQGNVSPGSGPTSSTPSSGTRVDVQILAASMKAAWTVPFICPHHAEEYVDA